MTSGRGEPWDTEIPEDVVDALLRPVPWLAPGVNGLQRARAWDAVRIIDAPVATTQPATWLEFHRYADGEVIVLAEGSDSREDGEAVVPLVQAAAEALVDAIEPPYAALLTPRGGVLWAVGARAVPIEPIDLGDLEAVSSISVAVLPGGEETVLVDDVEAGFVDADVAAAIALVRRIAAERYATFTATATRVGLERWELSVDPL